MALEYLGVKNRMEETKNNGERFIGQGVVTTKKTVFVIKKDATRIELRLFCKVLSLIRTFCTRQAHP